MQAIPGVPKLPDDYNPATWMLEICGGAAKMYVDSVDADFHAIYLKSDLAQRAMSSCDAITHTDSKAHAPLAMATRYATNRTQQVRAPIPPMHSNSECEPSAQVRG